jgi:HPt (histidine-containing phosphotransfer) domain-containing protein
MDSLDQRLERVRISFRAKAVPRAESLRADLAAENTAGLRSLAHDLHGMAGTFGFDTIGDLARVLEQGTIIAPELNTETRYAAAKLADALELLAKESP